MSCDVPNVHPVTIEAIIAVESGGNPLAINVNGVRLQPPHPRTAAEAVATAEKFIAAGYTVDMGLMQVNSANLAGLGSTVAEQFEPGSCANIRLGATILSAAYERALTMVASEQPALRIALSYYNTGNATRGFANGYVARYYGHQLSVPALRVTLAATRRLVPINPYTADATVWFAN